MRGLYAITDASLLPADALYEQCEIALQQGLGLLQYRDKQATTEQRLERASQLQTLCQHYNTALVINDDLTLAQQLGCGVHLGKGDSAIKQARAQLGAEAIVGASCYNSIDAAAQAIAAGASYVAFGRFFNSSTKPLASPANLAVLNEAKQQFAVPIVAIGGITPDNGGQLLNAGADMLAVIAGLWQTDELAAQCQRYLALFETADDGTR